MKRQAKKYLKQLDHADPKVRYDAVMALGKMGDPELLDVLDRVANLDDHPRVRDLASKAVTTLETLKKRQLERARATELDADDPLLWPELSKNKIMEPEERRKQAEDWTYEQSILEQRRRKKEAELERIQDLERQMRRRRWRRLPLRILLVLLVSIGCLVATAALRNYLDHRNDPKSEQAALEGLRDWLEAQQFAATDYQQLIQASTDISCSDLQGVERPETPIWVTDDNSLLTDYSALVTDLRGYQELMQQLNTQIEAACADAESVSLAEIDETVSVTGIPVRIQRASLLTASQIEQALTDLAAADATEEPADS